MHKETDVLQIQNNNEIIPLEGPWNVYFPKGWGAPDSVSLAQLVSWSEVPDEGVRYFSGTATYFKTFDFKRTSTLSRGYKVYLNLGDLAEIAEVWLNDQSLGIVWAKPYQIDITDCVKTGKNDLKIEVANTWKNRLIGDAVTNANYTTTNLTRGNPNLPRVNYLTHNEGKAPWGNSPLENQDYWGRLIYRLLKYLIRIIKNRVKKI